MRLLLLLTTFITGTLLTVLSVQALVLRQSPATAATIVYGVQSRHDVQLFQMRPNSVAPDLIPADTSLFDADYAPDGTWLAAIAIAEDGGDQLVRVDLPSGTVTPLADVGNEASPAISPDGTQVAFASGNRPTPQQLFVVDADGANLRQLTADTAANAMPTWTPDGASLIFSRTTTGSVQLYRYDLAQSNLAAITTNSSLLHGAPAVSPNGRWLAYTAYQPDTGFPQLYVISLAGGVAQQLTVGAQQVESPTWAADSIHIYYAAYTATTRNYDIYRIRLDGTDATALTTTPDINERHATLSPPIDSSMVVVVWLSVGLLMSVGSALVWGRINLVALLMGVFGGFAAQQRLLVRS